MHFLKVVFDLLPLTRYQGPQSVAQITNPFLFSSNPQRGKVVSLMAGQPVGEDGLAPQLLFAPKTNPLLSRDTYLGIRYTTSS